MEILINALANAYIYLYRKKFRYNYRLAQRKLRHAKQYLEQDFFSRASNIDRGDLLPEHTWALGILHNKERHCEEQIERYYANI